MSSYQIVAIDNDAVLPDTPDDAWLETSIRAQLVGLLRESARPCVGSWLLTPHRLLNRSGGTYAYAGAHFTHRVSAFAVIPVRLVRGARRIDLRLSGDLIVLPDYIGVPTITLTARLLSDINRVVYDSGPVSNLLALRNIDMSFDLPEVVLLERVDDIVLCCQSSVSATAYATADGLFSTSGRFAVIPAPFTAAEVWADAVLDYGPSALVRGYNPGVGRVSLRNSADVPPLGARFEGLNTYGAFNVNAYVSIALRTMSGYVPIAVRVGVEVDATIVATAALRANIPISGQTHAALSQFVALAQDMPRSVSVIPHGDQTATSLDLLQPRKWRLAHEANRIITQGSIIIGRDYGELELQLRLLVVDGNNVVTDQTPDLSSPPSTFEGVPVSVGLWQPTAAAPSLIDPDVVVSRSGDIRIWGISPGGTNYSSLIDIGRYAGGRAGEALELVQYFEGGPGHRDGLLEPAELGLLSAWALRVRVPLDFDPDLPVAYAVEIDPANISSLWADYPGLLVQCVGASITWDGRP